MVHSMYTYTVDITFYQNGSDYNVKVEWETGEVTHEPLAILTKDIPVDLVKYAKENDLLDQPGWKRFRRLARREVHLNPPNPKSETSFFSHLSEIQI
jgi:hypothetical protein